MGWRENQRAAILKSLQSRAVSAEVGLSSLMCLCERHDATNRVFSFSCNSQFLSDDEIAADAIRCEIPTLINAQQNQVPTNFAPFLCQTHLISFDAIESTTVDLTISRAQIEKMSFVGQRREPSLFGKQAVQHRVGAHSRLKNKIVGDAPPKEGQTLEERLRWILTPPVNELLSDPNLGLPHTPYDYQVKGIAWLRSKTTALLADEMGLGKTMQAIIAARLLWREQKISQILIVCPKTLVGTWRREIREWWPNARENICEPAGDVQFFLKLGTPNIIIKIINYEKLAREAEWLKKGERCGHHDLIIIDEAQRTKNPTSKTAMAVRSLNGTRRWALTGTPLETKTTDVKSIFDFIHPGLLEHDSADHVRLRIKPFMLRRRVEDVVLDLPDKDDQDVEVELGSIQREVYDRAESEGVIALNERGDTISVQHVFSLIQKLMQLCNFDPNSGESAKLERLNEDLEEIAENGRKLLVFSQFVSEPYGLKEVKKRLNPSVSSIVEMHGEIPPNRREAAIDVFTKDPSVNTMLLHYRVGGLGLNLQAANYVFLFDRWWNPAVEDQAVKRAHRIGQKNKVIVRRFFCRDTIEERILQKLAERRRLFAHVIDESRPHEAMGLTEEEYFSLFKNLRARPKRVRPVKQTPKIILDNLDPGEFEHLVASIYEAQGFEVRVIGGSHDGGVDIEAELKTSLGHDRLVIQCKHIKANVGRPDIQKLFGVISADQRVTRGDVVTSSDFSSEARSFARDKRISLVNREKLVQLAKETGVADLLNS